MAEIFLSYRSDDGAYAAAHIYAGLVEHFGTEHVFRDCNSMLPGTIYPPSIRAAVDRCDVLVAVIGPRWLDLPDQHGQRRIDSSNDWVRMELRAALRRAVPVVPLLLDGAALPAPDQLPEDVRGLVFAQAVRVRHRKLSQDVDEFAEQLERLAPGLRQARAEGPRSQRSREQATASQVGQLNIGRTVYASHGAPLNINNYAPGPPAHPEDRQ